MVDVSCARIRRPDFGVIDELARTQLCARRGGYEVRFTDLSDELVALIDLAGLGDVLRVEVRRQSEEREQLRGVEEERELADPSV